MSKTKEKKRFDLVHFSELIAGDRFHFPGKKFVFEFEKYSEEEKCFIYFKDGDSKEKVKKTDLPVIFLRNIKK